MDLKALVCTQCGGQIDRETLTCKHCGTAYTMDRKNTLIIQEMDPNETMIGASVDLNPLDLKFGGEDYIEYSISELSHQLASQLIPFMEVQTEVDLNRRLLELYGRIRVHKAKGNIYKVYEDILQKRRS